MYMFRVEASINEELHHLWATTTFLAKRIVTLGMIKHVTKNYENASNNISLGHNSLVWSHDEVDAHITFKSLEQRMLCTKADFLFLKTYLYH